MFPALSLLICHITLCVMGASVKLCDPANHICSGRCPDVPPNVQLLNNVALCMKDSITDACVCWFKGDSNEAVRWFHCEAVINGSSSQISCQVPNYCFPPDSEPTCLVIPSCDCQLIAADSPSFQFGDWKPVQAVVDMPTSSSKHASDKEFSLEHLLFLLGFVIAPLACWCLLNFINENKCKRKNMSSNQESTPISTERRSTIDQNVCQETARAYNLEVTNEGSGNILCQQLSAHPVACLPLRTPAVSSFPSRLKPESPPTYDEAISPNYIDLDDEGPPPSYAEAIQGHDTCVQQMHTMLAVHSHSYEEL